MQQHSQLTSALGPTRRFERPRARRAAVLAVAMALPIALQACSSSDSDDGGAENASQLVVLASDYPATFAPDSGAYSGTGQTTVVINTQATLLRNPYVEDATSGVLEQDWGGFEGFLAESWDVSDDGRVYTFHLREGLKSHAGNDLIADDVIWSMERHYNTDTAATKFVFEPYIEDMATQLVKVDDHTVELTLDRAGDAVTVLSLLSNLDAQIYDSTFLKSKATDDDPYAVAWSATNSGWGFGAYEVTSSTPGESVVMEANPDYAFGEPDIKKITVQVVPEAGTRASALLAGDADVAMGLLPSQIEDLGSSDDVQTFSLDTNLHLKMPMVTTQAPFDDPAVRQAMSYAIPYQEIIDRVYLGQAAQMPAILRTDSENYDGTGIEPLTYDPEKAKQILADAGYTEPVPVELTVSSGVPDAVDTGVVIQSFANDAGFDLTLNELSPADYGEGRNTGKFQAFLDRDQAFVMTPPYQLRLWTGKGSPFNLAQWESTAFYSAVDEALEFPDAVSAEAMQAWNGAEQVMREEMPIAFIAWLYPGDAVRAGIEGYATRSDTAIDYGNLTLE